jgi:phosphoribosyl 1,2-cyclic phosphodiesterase
MAKFCAMFSGSSGNCAYVEAGGSSLLIDAGVSARSICKALESIGSEIGNVAAILVTHEHSDHIKGLKALLSKYKIPVYANSGTIEGILQSIDVGSEFLNELKTGGSVEIAGMCVSSFCTSHDSRESVGYRIHTPDGKRISVATDLGYISDTVMTGISDCDIVMIESNHDVGMLQNGRYPYYLKRRILSKTGHLSNEDCSTVLPKLCSSGARHFVLAHLSRDNNFPELALETAVSAMKISGIPSGDYEIEVAPRSGPEHVLTL